MSDETIFIQEEDYLAFIEYYEAHLSSFGDLIAYSLIPNQYDLMIKLKTFEEINTHLQCAKPKSAHKVPTNFQRPIRLQIAQIFEDYTSHFRRRYPRQKLTLCPRITQKHVAHSEYYTNLIAYIHTSPVRKGYSETMDQWKYSSYCSFLFDCEETEHRREAINFFGGKSDFIEYHNKYNFYLDNTMINFNFLPSKVL